MSDEAISRAFREEGPAILATLIRQVGDFTLAEDALQDAFAAAVATWPRDGVPDRPGAGRSTGCGASAGWPTASSASPRSRPATPTTTTWTRTTTTPARSATTA